MKKEYSRKRVGKYMGALLLLCTIVILLWKAYDRYTYQALRKDPSLHSAMDENGVFRIDSLQDLGWFFRYINEGHEGLNGVLECDLDMAGKAVGGKCYRGTFDGNGHTISNRTTELFLVLETGSRVENLILENVSIMDEKYGCGAVAWSNYGEIVNCQVSGHVEGRGYTGGIAAENFGLILGCTNRAEVVSAETGEDAESSGGDMDYGAGGIAGLSATTKQEDDIPPISAIVNCVNEGNVTSPVLSGGICACLEDRTREEPANHSVQELVEVFGYSLEDAAEPAPDGGAGNNAPEGGYGESAPDVVDGRHYSVINCKNHGTVSVSRTVDQNGGYTVAGGICGDFSYGDLYHCANLGKVEISEEAPKVSETGWIYANRPMAITYIMGFAPTAKHHIVDCVSLKGTIAYAMRHENMMEIAKEELALWEKGELPYVSNNWSFDLEEAARVCSLEPLQVEESELSLGKDNYYLCEDFALKLPEGFEITEEYLDGDCYALRIRWGERETEGPAGEAALCASSDYEVWLLRKQADVDAALKEIRESNTLWRIPSFIEEVYGTLPNNHLLGIDSLNLPGHKCYCEKNTEGKRIFMENGIPLGQLGNFMREDDHYLGNLVSMPMEGNIEEGLEAKWMLLFTNHATNIQPDRDYIDMVEEGFYPLDGKEARIRVQGGDTLWDLAGKYTGSYGSWKMLADINGIEDPDVLLEGQELLVPDREAWEKRPLGIEEKFLQ